MIVPPAPWEHPWSGGHVLQKLCIIRGREGQFNRRRKDPVLAVARYTDMPQVIIQSAQEIEEPSCLSPCQSLQQHMFLAAVGGVCMELLLQSLGLCGLWVHADLMHTGAVWFCLADDPVQR